MKKNIINSMFGLAVASLMLTACSSADDAVTSSPTAPAIDDTAINFSAYVNRNTTRGGYEGELTTALLQGDANGFGVLAYYTDNQPYSSNATPNFMYNQQVKYETGNWTYSPLKYWPNEFGGDATSEGIDYLSFFAYAPFTKVDLVTGYANATADAAEYGIIGMTRSAESGYPKVRYITNFDPSKQVDLCWAAPLVGLKKDDYSTTDKVSFEFNHALAALNVQVDALFDSTDPTAPGSLDPNTRIWVRSVTFDGIAVKGELNLNNGELMPEWNDMYTSAQLNAEPVTLYDGRRDGREGVAAMANEKPLGINSVLVQDVAYTTTASTITAPAATKGVTGTAVNLFENTRTTPTPAATEPIYVIPTGVPMQITIVYDVETFDKNLTSSFLSDNKTNGSTIENKITKTILTDPADLDSGLVLEAGLKYTVKLHLGMTSVKADATVETWDDSTDNPDADLPANN